MMLNRDVHLVSFTDISSHHIAAPLPLRRRTYSNGGPCPMAMVFLLYATGKNNPTLSIELAFDFASISIHPWSFSCKQEMLI